MPLSNIQMQISPACQEFFPTRRSTHILNLVGLTKGVKMLPDFRSEILSTTNPTWTGLGSN